MTNHYHLVIQLTKTTLADGMRWLNGLYGQVFNKRHDASGHLFGGRYRTTFIEDAPSLRRPSPPNPRLSVNGS
jgi:putative transposase